MVDGRRLLLGSTRLMTESGAQPGHVLGIPLAPFGLLHPVIARAAMAFSSVSVVAKALTLRRWRGAATA